MIRGIDIFNVSFSEHIRGTNLDDSRLGRLSPSYIVGIDRYIEAKYSVSLNLRITYNFNRLLNESG